VTANSHEIPFHQVICYNRMDIAGDKHTCSHPDNSKSSKVPWVDSSLPNTAGTSASPAHLVTSTTTTPPAASTTGGPNNTALESSCFVHQGPSHRRPLRRRQASWISVSHRCVGKCGGLSWLWRVWFSGECAVSSYSERAWCW
jgi:hypothetical protein